VINKRVDWNCERSYYWSVFLWGESQRSKLFTLPSKWLVEIDWQSSTPLNVFQQDGAPAHKARIVKTYLSRKFPNRWIDIGSEIHEFPPRLPDITLFLLMSKTLFMQKNQRPEKTWKTAFEKRAGVLFQLYSAMSDKHSTVVSSVASNKTCLQTFNTIRCVSWLYWLEHSPVLLSLITNLVFTGWIVFFWSYFHWLNRLLILSSLAGLSSDLTFTSWIVFFWFYLYWLDRLLILPSLAGSSSSDLTFTGWIVFFWSYLH